MFGSSKIWQELIVPMAVIVFGVLYYFDTIDLQPQSTFFPRVLLVALGVLLIPLLVTILRQRAAVSRTAEDDQGGDEKSGLSWPTLKSPLLLMVLATGYVLLFGLTDYLTASILFVAVSLLVFRQSWPVIFLVPVGFVGALYVIFGMLFGIRI